MIAVMPEGVHLARDLVGPAMESAIGRLTPDVRKVAAYHLGFADAEGHPTGNGSGKALRPALALLSARAAGAMPRPARCGPRGPLVRSPLARTEHLDTPADLPLRMREVRDPAAYDPAMGLFRSAIDLFRGKAGKDREKAAAELLNEQSRTVEAQPVAAPREVRREARPDPNMPGWGQAID